MAAGRHATERIAARLLELHDVGAGVTQQLARVRASNVRRELEYPQSVEG
jgi:hypothetical protein